MKIVITLLLLLPLIATAQKKLNYMSSTEIIQKGLGHHEKEEYSEAIEEFQKVSINDTNYATAQYEMALSYFSLEQYRQAQKTLTDLLEFDLRFDFEHRVYSLLGSAYDNNKETDKAIEVYTEGIAKFPMQHTLYFNRAVTYEGMKQYDKALADYKQAIQCNMYHSSSHLRLGILAANEGLGIQATMSLMMFMLLEPSDSRAPQVIDLLEKIANGSFEKEPKNLELSEQGDIYEELNLFFTNKVALQKNYKTKFTVPTSYGNQFHFILKNITYDKANLDFWNQHYMPFYEKVWEENKIDAFVMLSLISIENDELAKKLTSKKKVITDFITWATPVFKDATSKQYMEFEGTKQFISVDYESGHINYMGKLREDGEPQGAFYYFHPNGSKRIIAHFDDAGNPTGTWEFYNMYNGNIERKKEFAAGGKENTTYDYYYSGELSDKYRLVDQLAQDTVYAYYRNGSLKEKYTMIKGVKNGKYLSYYPNGTVHYDIDYKNNLLEGTFISYHLNGQKQDEFVAKLNNIEGKRTHYYATGVVESEYVYLNDLYNGDFTTYFPSGKVESKGTYKNGKQVGQMTEYFTNGEISTSVMLDESGKQNGTSTYYDLDGKKYHEFQFNKGDLSAISFIDKKGVSKEIAAKKGKKIDYILNHPDGQIKVKGAYLDGSRTGKWEYYDSYGNLTQTDLYKAGIITDTVHAYFSNGQLKSITVYKDGNKDGIYLEYNIFGELVEEGFYSNDEYDKEWYSYYNDGTIKNESYFVNGTKNGIQKSYGVNGKLISWAEYDVGRDVTHVYLDTNENIADEFGEYNGKIELHNPSATFINYVGNYKNGNADGEINWFNPDKTVATTGQHTNSQRTGTWKWYFKNGTLEQEVTYVNGDREGLNTTNYENGKTARQYTYVNGDLQGPFKQFHENGNLKITGTYLDGNRHGKLTYYSPQGTVALIRNYNQDVIESYTYLDKEGKEVAPVSMDQQDLKIVAYFKNGKKSNEHTRKNGLVEGLYLAYHDNGQKWEEENYLHGEAHGKFYEYNEAGQKVYEADYLYGDLHGKETRFYTNGKVKSEKYYLSGSLHGKSTDYAPDGKVLSITTYYNNEIVSVQKF